MYRLIVIYVTALRQIADKCPFDAITADDILRDRIIFGIADNKVKERLLRGSELDFAKTLDICRASTSTLQRSSVQRNQDVLRR